MTGSTPGAAQVDATLPSERPCGLWRRFMSAGYESVVLFAVAVFFAYAFSALLRYEGTEGIMRRIFQIYLLGVFGLYFVWFWSRGRRTLPMKTVSIRLVDGQGRSLTPGRATARYLFATAFVCIPVALSAATGPVALVLLALPWAWAFFDPMRSTAYDRLAGTRLVIDDAPRP